MRIMVFDVPAERGGALTILEDFYHSIQSYSDKSIEWFIVVSIPNLKDSENIKVLKYPWVKRSWLHRLYFDKVIASKLVKKFKIDKVLSLQNITVPCTKVFQSLYVHQSIPFSEIDFNFIKEPRLWVYKNIISKQIFHSIKKADVVIFQTNWMKEKCLQLLNINPHKLFVVKPNINLKIKDKIYKRSQKKTTFFYPANPSSYKNHRIVLEACLELEKMNVKDYEVIFTLNGNENKNIKEISKSADRNDINMKFIGKISRDEVFELYTNTILIFPSYLETFGLPLLEASLIGTPIIASDCLYAKEVLGDYKNVDFFNYKDSYELSMKMKRLINKERFYNNKSVDKIYANSQNLIDIILNKGGG